SPSKPKRFIPPTLEEVTEYCQKRGNNINPGRFIDFFEASGWIDSKGNKVKNWKQKIITWEGREAANTAPTNPQAKKPPKGGDTGFLDNFTAEEIEEMKRRGHIKEEAHGQT
ncbi:MAG: hypothetical protein LBE55_01430, partial [Clostridiales bacterium]|nr:hypothetical protein [Clostridiales bacterium]